jgi:cation diffusion facilitator CzcD-associated flavoprotein CzcO
MSEHVDVLIVGAGLSGIGAAHHIQAAFPDRTYTILEARDAIGGTWDLFRYPGVRSDSDMHTLGYRFRPWTQGETIADGPSILGYIRDTAAEAAIDKHIRFNHLLTRATWSSATARWTVQAVHGAEERTLTCGFLLICSGYYRYDEGYLPQFPGIGDFRGLVVHPQHWPADLDYAGQRIVVIGSGATAVTLVPAMAQTAGHVTMLQRSPSYILTLPHRGPYRQPAADAAWYTARVRHHAMEERADNHVDLPAQPPSARQGPRLDPEADDQAVASRIRRRHPLQSGVQPVGPMPVPCTRRRPVQGHPRRPGLRSHGSHHHLH